LAFALQSDGWYLRADIVWAKPNPMPESVTDRPTKAHEYIFLLTKSAKYFFDQEAVREAALYEGDARHLRRDVSREPGVPREDGGSRARTGNPTSGRNIRTVWTIPTYPYPDAHFATFPPEIPDKCIRAGTSEKGRCPGCRTPWARTVEKKFSQTGPDRDNITGQKNMQGWEGWPRGSTEAKTLGWEPGCGCLANAKDGMEAELLAPIPCTVLDPFMGSGTTGLVAQHLNRNFVGIEINPEYAEMAERRIAEDMPLFH